MPTLQQLPQAVTANPVDSTLIEQNGTTCMVAVQTLLGTTQAQITLAAGSLLGRVGIGPGGPQPVPVGAGLTMSTGTLTVDPTLTAPLASPAFTGTPTAPTPPPTDSSNAVATTAFVQSHTTPALLPPATASALGGIKIGSGLSVASDGTAAIVACLPGIDASNTMVTGCVAGSAPRKLSDLRGEVINVADLLGARPTGQDATAAMLAALAIAATSPGCTIMLCQGQWNFASLTTGLSVPSNTTVKGAGKSQVRSPYSTAVAPPLLAPATSTSRTSRSPAVGQQTATAPDSTPSRSGTWTR